MIVYQLVATWRDRLGNLHKAYHKKLFASRDRATNSHPELKEQIGPVTFFDTSEGIVYHVIELEIVP